jgi:predicted protein tyrosine phosphatase
VTKTQQIFNLTAPYRNPYQGDAKRVLFVCTVGMLRSPTAASVGHSVFGWNTRSCGVDEVALIPLSVNLIMWADKIVFFEDEHYQIAMKTFAMVDYDEDIKSKSHVLDITDDFNYMDEWLSKLLVTELETVF